MKHITIEENSLPFGFFEKIGFSFENVALNCIKEEFGLSDEDCQEIFNINYDLFSEEMYALMNEIDQFHAGEEEVDESSGTWVYITYEVTDLDRVLESFNECANLLFKELIKKIEV